MAKHRIYANDIYATFGRMTIAELDHLAENLTARANRYRAIGDPADARYLEAMDQQIEIATELLDAANRAIGKFN